MLLSCESVKEMTKEEVTTACHTTLLHIFTGILVSNNLLEERSDGLYAYTESAEVDEGDMVELEEELHLDGGEVTEETPISVQDVFQIPRLRIIEEEPDPESPQEEPSLKQDSPVLTDSDSGSLLEPVEFRCVDPQFTKQDHEFLIQHVSSLDPRFLIVMDAENIAMNHGRNLFFSVKGIEIVRDFYEKQGHIVVGFVPEYCLDNRNWSSRWAVIKKKLDAGEKPLDSDRYTSTPDDMETMIRLQREGVITASPGRDYSDSYTIEYAKSKNGIIITNDRYNDAKMQITDLEKRKITERWFRNHVITYSFVGDDFIPNPDYEPPDFFEISENE